HASFYMRRSTYSGSGVVRAVRTSAGSTRARTCPGHGSWPCPRFPGSSRGRDEHPVLWAACHVRVIVPVARAVIPVPGSAVPIAIAIVRRLIPVVRIPEEDTPMYIPMEGMVTVKSVMPVNPTHARPSSPCVASAGPVAAVGRQRLDRGNHRKCDPNDDEHYS